ERFGPRTWACPLLLAVWPGVSYPAHRTGSTGLLPQRLLEEERKILLARAPRSCSLCSKAMRTLPGRPAVTDQPFAKEDRMRFLNLFRSSHESTARSTSPRRTFRPQLEQLDERLVLSTLSSAISFPVNGGWYSFTEHDWYSVDQAGGQVVQFAGTHRYDLAG